MDVVRIHQFDVLLISLAPTLGAEIKKARPCVVISPDEMNKYLRTLIIAPMTSTLKDYPTRIPLTFEGKQGNIVLDQIRTIDKSRMIKKLGTLEEKTTLEVLTVLQDMFS